MTIYDPAPGIRSIALRAFTAICGCLLCVVFDPPAHAAGSPPAASADANAMADRSAKAPASKKSFDIPAGDAFTTLKRFFTQSGEQLIYKADSLERVKTNAVKGEFTAREALDRMLAQTGLAVKEDDKTGSLAIMPAAKPNGASGSASPTHENSASAKKKTEPVKSTKNPIAVLAGWLALALAPGHTLSAADGSAAGASTAGAITGSLAGRVVDRDGGIGLPGAQVTLANIGLVTSSDRQGDFVLTGVPSGHHTLHVSYVGRSPVTQAVTVAAGDRTAVRVALGGIETVQLDAFVVTGIVEGASRALNQQRTAPNLQNIVSADAIGQFPDPNLA
ncbi:MAG: carboxypeptidase regulatory-like domain-containing protein, partial [Opitutaceae bacterium]